MQSMVQLKQRVSVMWPTLGTLTGLRIGKREVGVHMDGGYIIRERIPTGPLLIFFVYIAYDIIEINRILKHFFCYKKGF